MKKVIVASNSDNKVEAVYMHCGEYQPQLHTIVVYGGDEEEALLKLIDKLDLYIEEDFSDPDEYDFQDIMDAIEYYNTDRGEGDYIFSLAVDGTLFINNIVSK